MRLPFPSHDPALGPRLLFFSGGTALRGLSRLLPARTHRSIHLVTPFDSGGSSAALREALGMPAVGDLRNRILALADGCSPAGRELHDLLAHRLPAAGTPAALRRELEDVVRRLPPRVAGHLHACLEAVGARFDVRHASVGNLVLAGIYLGEGRSLYRAAELLSELVGARGTVRPVVDDDLHLAAKLADGRTVVGQHRLTGRDVPPLDSPVEALFLTRSHQGVEPLRPSIPTAVAELIRSADLICYPIGSFYTSLLATLLPVGVARTIAQMDVPKVYVPNPSHDPEEIGLTMPDKVRTLLRYLQEGSPPRTPAGALLRQVLVDAAGSRLPAEQLGEIEALEVRVMDVPLVSDRSAPYLDDALLAGALLSMA